MKRIFSFEDTLGSKAAEIFLMLVLVFRTLFVILSREIKPLLIETT